MPSIDVLVKLRYRLLLDLQRAHLLPLDLLAALQNVVYTGLMRRKSCRTTGQLLHQDVSAVRR